MIGVERDASGMESAAQGMDRSMDRGVVTSGMGCGMGGMDRDASGIVGSMACGVMA